MTMADLSPDHLAVMEAKLRADLEAVQKVRALMEEHLSGRASAIAVPALIPAPLNVTVTTMGSSLEQGGWGSRDVPRYGQPTLDFETGRTWSCAQHG